MVNKTKNNNFGSLLNIVASPIIYKDKMLLIKRIKAPYIGYWSMPGGKIDFGEHIDEAILREIEEETGLIAKFICVRGVVSEILYSKNKKDAHFLIWVCETRARRDTANTQSEGTIKWFTKRDINNYKKKIIPSDFEMIKNFFLKKYTKKIILHKSLMHSKGKKYSISYFGK